MRPIYLVSEEEYSGVSVISIGLGLELKRAGHKVGYMKPLGYMPVKSGDFFTDVDARFMWELLEIEDPLELASPVVLTPNTIEARIAGDETDHTNRVLEAYAKSSQGKDAFIIECGLNMHQGHFLGVSVFDLVERLDAAVLLVERFDESNTIDKLLHVTARLRDSLAGVIINMVPPERETFVKGSLVPYVEKLGIRVLGCLPYTKALKSTTIETVAKSLGADILCARQHTGNLVEQVVVGAMGPERALSYFRRAHNFAVVTGGDRAEVQVAALESKAKCLILTGNYHPSSIVLAQAEAMGVPILLVELDTITAADRAEWMIGHARSHEEPKREIILQLVREHLDLPAIHSLMGLGE